MKTFLAPPERPLEGGLFQCLHAVDGPAAMDQLGLVRTVDSFPEGVVVGVTHAAGGREDVMLVKVRAVENTDVLGAVIRVMHESTRITVPGCPADGLVQREQGQILGGLARAHGPAHNPSGVSVGHERHISETSIAQMHVGDIGHMQTTGSGCAEPALH